MGCGASTPGDGDGAAYRAAEVTMMVALVLQVASADEIGSISSGECTTNMLPEIPDPGCGNFCNKCWYTSLRCPTGQTRGGDGSACGVGTLLGALTNGLLTNMTCDLGYCANKPNRLPPCCVAACTLDSDCPSGETCNIKSPPLGNVYFLDGSFINGTPDTKCTTVSSTTSSITSTTTTTTGSTTTTTVSSTTSSITSTTTTVTSTVRRTSTATTTATTSPTTSPTTISMAGSLDTSGADPPSSSGMVAGVVVSLLVVGAAGGAFVLCRRRNAAAARAAVLEEIQQEEDRRNTHQMEENPMLAAKRRANAVTVTNPSFEGPSSASVAKPICTDYEYAQGGPQDKRTAGIGGDGSDSSSGGNSDGMQVYDQIYAIYDPGASAHVKSYLRGEISRNTAEADLADKPTGTFLIRKKTGNFVISVVVKAGDGADNDVQYRHDMIMVERVTAAVYGEVVTAQQYRFKMNGQVVGNPPATTLSSVVAHLAVNASMLGVQLINHGLTLPRSNDGHDVYEYGGATPLGDVDTNAEYEMPAQSCDEYLCSVSVGAEGSGTMPDATPGGITHVYTAVAGDQVVACRYGCGFSCKLGDRSTIKAHEGTCVSFYTTPHGAGTGSAA